MPRDLFGQMTRPFEGVGARSPTRVRSRSGLGKFAQPMRDATAQRAGTPAKTGGPDGIILDVPAPGESVDAHPLIAFVRNFSVGSTCCSGASGPSPEICAGPEHPDWAERAAEVENDDVLEGLDEASRAEVARDPRRARLGSISGAYGRCIALRAGDRAGAARPRCRAPSTCVACAAV